MFFCGHDGSGSEKKTSSVFGGLFLFAGLFGEGRFFPGEGAGDFVEAEEEGEDPGVGEEDAQPERGLAAAAFDAPPEGGACAGEEDGGPSEDAGDALALLALPGAAVRIHRGSPLGGVVAG